MFALFSAPPWGRSGRDARDAQILFLSAFLGLGCLARDWTLQPPLVLAAIGSCQGMQWLLGRRAGVSGQITATAWKSALITSLGLCLLLRSNHPTTMLLAGGLAIASKFALQIRGKHVYNPANFGLLAALLLSGDAWVSPGQWGNTGWLLAIFLGAGGLVLGWVGRWETSVAFLVAYGGLEALRDGLLGWDWDVWAHQLSSGSLLVFALFMLTDPRSIPDRRRARVLWAVAIAVLTFVLHHWFFLTAAPFWALWGLAPLTPLLDRWLPDERFTWQPASEGSLD